jgi:hypothetical protein
LSSQNKIPPSEIKKIRVLDLEYLTIKFQITMGN